MAAKINGVFELDDHSFDFTAIAFGRIGGQNIGAKLSDDTKKTLSDLRVFTASIYFTHTNSRFFVIFSPCIIIYFFQCNTNIINN